MDMEVVYMYSDMVIIKSPTPNPFQDDEIISETPTNKRKTCDEDITIDLETIEPSLKIST